LSLLEGETLQQNPNGQDEVEENLADGATQPAIHILSVFEKGAEVYLPSAKEEKGATNIVASSKWKYNAVIATIVRHQGIVYADS
jgi:hypothetical protein